MTQKQIAQGAEAIIFKDGERILKKRIKKPYRIAEIDEKLRKSRTKGEAKILEKARNFGVNVPKVLKQDKFELEIEFIDGDKLSEKLDCYDIKKQKEVIKKIAEQIKKLHENDIIHGDLTTSNMILKYKLDAGQSNASQDKISNLLIFNKTNINKPKAQKVLQELFDVYFIDFGLGFISKKIEDKAVDIHLFRQALEAKHFKDYENLFSEFLFAYDNKEVIERLKKVEARGRYKVRI